MIPTIKQLNKLSLQIHRNVPAVNNGGCCVVAVELAQRLRDKFPTKIRVSSKWVDADAPIEQIAQSMDDTDDLWSWYDNGVDMGHVFVEFEHNGHTYFMDSTGVHPAGQHDPAFNWSVYDGHLPINIAKQLADYGDWNATFNRRYIPTIRKYVSTFFEQFA